MPTATYIGAGLDLRPIILFPLIDTFIYIDSMPISPYGLYQLNLNTTINI